MGGHCMCKGCKIYRCIHVQVSAYVRVSAADPGCKLNGHKVHKWIQKYDLMTGMLGLQPKSGLLRFQGCRNGLSHKCRNIWNIECSKTASIFEVQLHLRAHLKFEGTFELFAGPFFLPRQMTTSTCAVLYSVDFIGWQEFWSTGGIDSNFKWIHQHWEARG